MKQYRHERPEERYSVVVKRDGRQVDGVQPERISDVLEEVMVWWKANQIHGWFVTNVMDGQDSNNGHMYRVGEEKLRELFAVCQKVVDASELVELYENPVCTEDDPKGLAWRVAGKVIKDAAVADAELPPREGTFFGSYKYDEDYLNQVVLTRDWARQVIAEIESGLLDEVYYSSSW